MQRVERGARRTKPLGERVEGVKYFRSILLVLLAGIVLHVVFHLKVHSFRELTSANPLIAYLLISTVGLIFVAFIVITTYAFSAVKLKAEVLVLNERLQNKSELIRSLQEKQHDFRNQLSVVLGLLHLGWNQHAKEFLKQVIGGDQAEDADGKVDEAQDYYTFYGFLIHKTFTAASRNVLIKLEMASNRIPAVPVDMLMRIAGNLIDNAIEAASAVQDGRVLILIQAEQDKWTLIVWNNGPAISEDILPHIWEPGFSTKPGQDHGWGLPSVQSILSEYGATLEHDSEADGGTSFVVRFALDEVPVEHATAKS